MATITYLALDADYDPIFADGTSLTDAAAVSQAILTRLRLFYGEWWESLTTGLPVFQSMLGQLGSQRGLNAIQLTTNQAVLAVPYVTDASGVQVSFIGGKFTYTGNALTAFGSVPVVNIPGSSAIL